MTTLIVDDLDIPPSTIAAALTSKISDGKNDNGVVERLSTLWRIEKDGKRTCLEVKKLK